MYYQWIIGQMRGLGVEGDKNKTFIDLDVGKQREKIMRFRIIPSMFDAFNRNFLFCTHQKYLVNTETNTVVAVETHIT